MKIELILLGIIGFVFLIDFIINNIGKKIDNQNGLIKSEDNQSKSNNPFNYLLKRKKNFTIYIILIPTAKVVIHYLFYPIMTRDLLKQGNFGIDRIFSKEPLVHSEYSQSYKASVGEHINVIFNDELLLFIPAFILVSLVVWFFNDKIKAR